MTMKRIEAILMWPNCVAHELCHYAAARLLGLEAKRYRYNTVFYPTTQPTGASLSSRWRLRFWRKEQMPILPCM